MNARWPVCAFCGADAKRNIVECGTVSAWRDATVELNDEGKIVVVDTGRIEKDDDSFFDVDEYQCIVCMHTEYRLEALVRVNHPWSALPGEVNPDQQSLPEEDE